MWVRVSSVTENYIFKSVNYNDDVKFGVNVAECEIASPKNFKKVEIKGEIPENCRFMS